MAGDDLREARSAVTKNDVDQLFKSLSSQLHLIDATNSVSWTLIHFAARSGHGNIVELLVRLGSKSIDACSSSGWTPMHVAAYTGHVSVIETLIRLGSKAIDATTAARKAPVSVAASLNHVESVKALKALGADLIHPLATANSETERQLLSMHVVEDEVLEVRYRVFFLHTLTWRLLSTLEGPTELLLAQQALSSSN